MEIEVTLTEAGTLVRLRGDVPALIESSTFIVWLSTAVRAAPEGCLAYCRPEIFQVDNASWKITHRYPESSREPKMTCWHKMFRNPVIAEGYTIAPRSMSEKGVEMSFSMMAILAQTPFVTCFEGTTMLKGFSTILSLTERASASFVWHFLIDQHRKRMPYDEGLRITGLRQEIHEQDLQRGRHFVGWTPCVDMLAGKYHATNVSQSNRSNDFPGTTEANYDIGRTDQFTHKPPLISVGNITIGLSKIISMGVTFVPGKKDIPDALHDMRPAEERIIAALDWNVLFYDTMSRQAWLLDGPSALLHICRAWLDSEPARSLLQETAVNPVSVFQHAKPDGGTSEAVKLLLDRGNRNIELYRTKSVSTIESSMNFSTNQRMVEEKTSASWHTWGDLVEARVLALEHLHDHKMVEHSRRTPDVRLPLQDQRMEGYDFQEIMKLKRKPQRWEARFKSSSGGWLDFAESCNAVPIFGKAFGDLLRPTTGSTNRTRTCLQLTSLPQGKDYLAVSMEVLHRLTKHFLTDHLHYVKLGHSTYWLDPGAAFTSCACDQKTCHIPIATLASREPASTRPLLSLRQLFSSNLRGAVIFPCTPNKVKKPPLPKALYNNFLAPSGVRATASHDAVGDRMLQYRQMDMEDACAGVQLEGVRAPEQSPDHGMDHRRNKRDAFDCTSDSGSPRTPATGHVNNFNTAQHRDDCVSVAEREDKDCGAAAGSPGVFVRPVGSRQNTRLLQPRLRKRKASRDLREQGDRLRGAAASDPAT